MSPLQCYIIVCELASTAVRSKAMLLLLLIVYYCLHCLLGVLCLVLVCIFSGLAILLIRMDFKVALYTIIDIIHMTIPIDTM